MARAPDENVNRWLQPHRLSFDFGRKNAVVVNPLNCMVGCNTCANAYSRHAIEFPPLDTVFELEGEPEVRHASKTNSLRAVPSSPFRRSFRTPIAWSSCVSMTSPGIGSAVADRDV